MLARVREAIDRAEFGWSLCLVGEDGGDKLAELTGDLRAAKSDDGNGKQFASGFSYWGIEPTIAWMKASTDPYYAVMKVSVETFVRRWRNVKKGLGDASYHYVSLGPGTGSKDYVILQDLERANRLKSYIPVDISAEMLRLAVRDPIRNLILPKSQVLPVQLDFSRQNNVDELRFLLNHIVGDEPILYSILGNTMANFTNDTEVMRNIRDLLRPNDRLAIEVATAEALSRDLLDEALAEYERIGAFREFVTSALLHYTDISIDMDSVLFSGEIEGDRAIKIKVLYRNQTGEGMRLTLPDRSSVHFPAEDTIRLYTTRKYLRDNLNTLMADWGLTCVNETHSDFSPHRGRPGFGMDLLIAEMDPESNVPVRDITREIWT
jgi:uncharacterized SAM-dependent methyltransferase